MLGKTSIIFFLLLANLLAHAGLKSELEMLKKEANIKIHAWDSKQSKNKKKTIKNTDSISLTSSALRKPAILKGDEEELAKLRSKSEIKKTRKRSR